MSGDANDQVRKDGLEQAAARIADEQPVDWKEFGAGDAAMLSGLREIEQLAQGFRHLHVSAVAPAAPRGGRFRFGALQVLDPLGSGAQGEVWRAYDPLLDLHVALKLRRIDSDALSHQFLEEARRLARVRQANIVSVYGAAVHEGRAGVWTELVRGSTLAEVLDQHGTFPPDEVRGIGLDLCHALAAVHRHGIVHGDVKAENVMREVSGRIVLMDFGAAREFDRADASVISGTLRYLAPELLRGAAPSPATDVYALGVLLFHLLSGAWPQSAADFDGLLRAHDAGTRVRLRGLCPQLPAELARAIDRALDPDPRKRHASALAFAAALAPAPRRSRTGLAFAAAAAVVLAVAAAAFWRGGAGPAWDAQVGFARIGADGETALADGAGIDLGDRLVLNFRSNRPAWVYVFDDDGSSDAGVLFPLAGIEPANPLAGGTGHRLPGTRGGESIAWTVSSKAEREEFIVVAATAPQPALEAAIGAWRRAGEETPGPARGAMTLSPTAAQGEIESASLRNLVRQVERDDNVRHWRVVFPHAAR